MNVAHCISITLSLAALVISCHVALNGTRMVADGDGPPAASRHLETMGGQVSSSRFATREPEKIGLASIEKDLLQLRKSVEMLEKRMNRDVGHNSPHSLLLKGGGDSETPLASNEEVDTVHEQETQEHFSRLDLISAGFQAEKADEDWSREMNRMIMDAFAGDNLAKSQLLEVECRRSLCRVHVSLGEQESPDDLFRGLLPLVSEELPGALIHEEEGEQGSSRTVIYFARKGYDLPRVQ